MSHPVRSVTTALALLLAGVTTAVMFSTAARAQENFPTRPIKLLVPFAPGGTTDLFARKYAVRLARKLNQPVVPENKAGAAGAIAAAETARAAADGYTLFFASSTTMAILPSMMSKPTYDVERDFAPVALLGITPLMVAVNSNLPAKTLPELLTLLKANPGKYSYGTSGTGSANHLVGELFKKIGGVDLLHVPYKGSAPAVQDLIGGQTHVLIDAGTVLLPQVKGGRLKALAVTGSRRDPNLPDVPTVREQGFAGLEAAGFQGLVGPAGMPREIVDRLSSELVRVLAQPDVRSRFAAAGSEVTPRPAAEFAAYVKAESEKWSGVIRTRKLQLD